MQVPEANIVKKSMTLIGFSGEHKATIGEITLPVYTEGVNLHTKFQIIDAPSAYNVILGRPWIHELKAVPSTYHQVIRFPTPWGIRQIRGEQIASRDCYRSAFKTNHVQVQEVNQIDEASMSNSKYEHGKSSNLKYEHGESSGSTSYVEPEMKDLDEVQIHPDHPNHVVQIGSRL